MRVRLRDFAELNRISERVVQIRIKENIAELEPHVERRGKQGTWLDEYAQEFLLKCIKLPTKEDVYIPSPREAALLTELSEANKKLADAERRAGENAEAAGRVHLLEASNEKQEAQIHDLSVKVGSLEERVGLAEKTAQEASEELTAIKSKWWYKMFSGKKGS